VFPASMLLLSVAYTVAPRFEYLPGVDGATSRTPFMLGRCPVVTGARKCIFLLTTAPGTIAAEDSATPGACRTLGQGWSVGAVESY
jgi:hypothetical protein